MLSNVRWISALILPRQTVRAAAVIFFSYIYSLVQGHAVLPQFVDVSIISVYSLSIATAMKVKDFLNLSQSEVRSGWTEHRGTVDLFS